MGWFPWWAKLISYFSSCYWLTPTELRLHSTWRVDALTEITIYLSFFFIFCFDLTCEPKPLNTSHVSQKWDDYYLALICHSNIRQTSERASVCNCPCLARQTVGTLGKKERERETPGLLHLAHDETHSQNIARGNWAMNYFLHQHHSMTLILM